MLSSNTTAVWHPLALPLCHSVHPETRHGLPRYKFSLKRIFQSSNSILPDRGVPLRKRDTVTGGSTRTLPRPSTRTRPRPRTRQFSYANISRNCFSAFAEHGITSIASVSSISGTGIETLLSFPMPFCDTAESVNAFVQYHSRLASVSVTSLPFCASRNPTWTPALEVLTKTYFPIIQFDPPRSRSPSSKEGYRNRRFYQSPSPSPNPDPSSNPSPS